MEKVMALMKAIHDKNNPYVTLNKQIVPDPTLSFKAKGIWLYAFSKPEDWQFYEKDIIKTSSDSVTSVRNGLKELEKIGYLYRSPQKRENGSFRQKDWYFFETLEQSREFKKRLPLCGFQTSVNSTTTNQPLLSNEELSNEVIKEKGKKEKDSNRDTPNPSRGSLPPPSFPSSQSHKKKPKAFKIQAPKKDTTPKYAYGEDKCIFLTKEQYKKIVLVLGGEKEALDLIEEMNDYVQSVGKTYKSHYHALRRWHRENRMKKFIERKKQENKKDSKLRGWEEKDEDDDWQPTQAKPEDFE